MKNLFFSKVDNFRYERKFYIEGLKKEDVEAMLKLHPGIFREIYYERTVNSIYLDLFNLENYYDNLNGADKRLKVRIRWYGDLLGLIENPMLELKLKHNLHCGKLVIPLKPFTLDNNFSIDVMRSVFKNSSLDEVLSLHLKELNFSLLNSYSRKYFLSADQGYRITIDTNLSSYGLSPYKNNFLYKVTDYIGVILELKYNKSQDIFADNITNYFPFRMTRSSKYVTGITELCT